MQRHVHGEAELEKTEHDNEVYAWIMANTRAALRGTQRAERAEVCLQAVREVWENGSRAFFDAWLIDELIVAFHTRLDVVRAVGSNFDYGDMPARLLDGRRHLVSIKP
jgi:hypothetical protein